MQLISIYLNLGDNIATCLETWLQLQREHPVTHKIIIRMKDIVDRVRGYQYDMLKNLQPVLDRFKLEEKYTHHKKKKDSLTQNDLKVERAKNSKRTR